MKIRVQQIVKSPLILAGLILLTALFLRFWQLEKFAVFDYDQERDAFLIREILINHRLMLIGAKSGPTGLYTGSLYLYLLAPFYWLFRGDPLGGAVLAGLVGVLTTAGLIWFGAKLFGSAVGLIAGLLYGTSLVMVGYDQIVWNPTFLPITSTVLVGSLLLAKIAKPVWLIPAGLSLGLSFHFHFAAFYLVIFVVLAILYRRLKLDRNLFLGIAWFLLLISPLLVFELRHQGSNSRQILNSLSGGARETHSFGVQTLDAAQIVIKAILAACLPGPKSGLPILAVLVLVGLKSSLRNTLSQDLAFRELIKLGLLLILAAVLVSAGSGMHLVPYYFLPLFPVAFLILARLIGSFFQEGSLTLLTGLIVLAIFLSTNLKALSRRQTPVSLWAKKKAVQTVITAAQGKPFRLSVTADQGWDWGFDYLFLNQGISDPRHSPGPAYTLVVPHDFQGIKSEFIYGGVGIIFPERDD